MKFREGNKVVITGGPQFLIGHRATVLDDGIDSVGIVIETGHYVETRVYPVKFLRHRTEDEVALDNQDLVDAAIAASRPIHPIENKTCSIMHCPNKPMSLVHINFYELDPIQIQVCDDCFLQLYKHGDYPEFKNIEVIA